MPQAFLNRKFSRSSRSQEAPQILSCQSQSPEAPGKTSWSSIGMQNYRNCYTMCGVSRFQIAQIIRSLSFEILAIFREIFFRCKLTKMTIFLDFSIWQCLKNSYAHIFDVPISLAVPQQDNFSLVT